MILKVIFAQRKCNYPGEFAPEAMECMTGYAYEDNSEWLDDKLEEYNESNEYVSAKIIDLKVSQYEIEDILSDKHEPLDTIINI